MADYKRRKDDKVLIAEFNVSMHCNACERGVARAISNIKGVEKFMTDMPRHRLVVTGQIDPEKVVRKIKKKTGKRAQILARKEDKEHSEEEEDFQPQETPDQYLVQALGSGCFFNTEGYTMFSDENPNACSIM